jgi:hypothetical protein
MRRTAFATFATAALFAALGLTSSAGGSAQGSVSLAVDADPSGNTATTLSTIDRCVSVRTGDTFSIDFVIRDVTQLIGFNADLVYDPSILTVVDRDMDYFLAANEGSNVFDASAVPPGDPGVYDFGAADIADPPVPDSGSGVLARLTLQAVGPGVSPAATPRLDLNGDTTVDAGPILSDVAGQHIDDEDGDGYFEGRASDAWVAVDSPCPDVPPTVFPTPPRATATPSPTGAATNVGTVTPTPTVAPPAAGEGSDNPPWVIIGAVAGGVALAAGAFVWWRFGRRSH